MTSEQQIYQRNYYLRNRAKKLVAATEYRTKNSDRLKEYFRALGKTEDRRTQQRDASRRRRKADPKGQYRRERNWRDKNRWYDAFHNAKAKAKKLGRIPAWADLAAIRAFYKATPPGMTVDHIIPMKGRTASGLHVLQNLQYLTPDENRRKSNVVH